MLRPELKPRISSSLQAAERLVQLRRSIDGPHRVHARLRRRRPAHLPLDLRARSRYRRGDARYRPAVSGNLRVWAETERRYGRRIRAIYPMRRARAAGRQAGHRRHFTSRSRRACCCDVRKTRPLDSALDGASAWITGLRGDQNTNRREGGLGRLRRQPRPDQAQPAIRLDARGRAGRGAQAQIFRSTACMRKALPRSAARLARAPSRPASPNATGAGGGSKTAAANAGCICRARSVKRAATDNLRRDHVEMAPAAADRVISAASRARCARTLPAFRCA